MFPSTKMMKAARGTVCREEGKSRVLFWTCYIEMLNKYSLLISLLDRRVRSLEERSRLEIETWEFQHINVGFQHINVRLVISTIAILVE